MERYAKRTRLLDQQGSSNSKHGFCVEVNGTVAIAAPLARNCVPCHSLRLYIDVVDKHLLLMP